MKLLERERYPRVATLVRDVSFNNLFARAILEGLVDGRIYVDDRDSPRAALVIHPYGMAMLAGKSPRPGFNTALRSYIEDASVRERPEWLQVYPESWNDTLNEWMRDAIGSNQAVPETTGNSLVVTRFLRVNFRFNPSRYELFRRDLVLPAECGLSDDLAMIHAAMDGVVTPRAFWSTREAFVARGAARAVLWEGELASTAFSAFRIDHYLELGIESRERFRHCGLATHACAALIDHCLERGLEPVWSCRRDNVGSYHLAHNLGFEPDNEVPYYRLPAAPTHF